ncbi:MAG: hypothetical protein ACFFG0_10180 [Candidatus Thorarchaeota archaeon]
MLELDCKIEIGSMPRFKASDLYVHIATDVGIDGWSLSHWNLSNAVQKVIVEEAHEKLLISKDPFMTEDIFKIIYLHLTE